MPDGRVAARAEPTSSVQAYGGNSTLTNGMNAVAGCLCAGATCTGLRTCSRRFPFSSSVADAVQHACGTNGKLTVKIVVLDYGNISTTGDGAAPTVPTIAYAGSTANGVTTAASTCARAR